jgi:two-component system KDP operon response regulator KdpE
METRLGRPSAAKPLILLIDADASIRQVLTRTLARAGYRTVTAADGLKGIQRFEQHRPDLIVTDVTLPRAGGFKVISAVRQIDHTPVVVLSERDGEKDKVRALDLGADDYIVKPFSLRELLARLRALLRRSGMALSDVLRFPDLVIDRGRRTVVQGGREVRLTPTELAILELLASRAGIPMSLNQIIAVVWKGNRATTVDTVRVHISSLRRKLEPDPAKPRYIGTWPTMGYRFLAEPVEG